jgi:cytidylate kinase
VLLDGIDISDQIRTPEVTEMVRHVADHPGIRRHLVQLQRELALGRDLVSEGRDQGTIAFADSGCKIFLTATAAERARRRMHDFQRLGQSVNYQDVLAQINHRDQRDQTRPVAPLVPAPDAVVVVTDGMSIEEVIDHLEQIVRSRMPSQG